MKSRIVLVEIIKLTTKTSINSILNGHLKSCRKSTENNFKLEFIYEEEKTVILELGVSFSELRTEFYFLQYCRSRVS